MLTVDERVDLLDAAAVALAGDDHSAAGPPLERLFADLSPDRPDDLTFQIFGQALARRAGRGAPNVNLYLRDLNLRQISLFNLLATHLGFVRRSGEVTNDILAGLLADTDGTTLIDVGIGTGQQEVAVLRALAERDRLPRRLRVVGIEPSPSILADAERAFGGLRDELGLEVSFTGVLAVAEDLTDQQWAELREIGGDIIVNAAFAAHHIQSDGRGAATARDHVFRQLRTLEPRAMTLIEPHSDHLEPVFLRRFRNCWAHFGTALRAIDACPATVTERLAMKMFFAREIDDIIANAESSRAERHERTEAWMQRLDRVGFGVVRDLPMPQPVEGMTVDSEDGWVRMGFDGVPMVASICAGREDAPLSSLGWSDTTTAGAAGGGTVAPVFATDPGRHGAALLRVRDVMDPEVVTTTLGTTLADAAAILHGSGASDLVVLDHHGAFIGVASEGDLIRTMLPDQAGFEGDVAEGFEVLAINGRARSTDVIDDLVIRDPIVLGPDDDLLRVASIMVEHQIRRLPVIADGAVVGTVSRADLVAALITH